MKPSSIREGATYTDGVTRRTVYTLDLAPQKHNMKYSDVNYHKDGKFLFVKGIGECCYYCTLGTFARWAKAEVTDEQH